jgi:hypothetical protein
MKVFNESTFLNTIVAGTSFPKKSTEIFSRF